MSWKVFKLAIRCWASKRAFQLSWASMRGLAAYRNGDRVAATQHLTRTITLVESLRPADPGGDDYAAWLAWYANDLAGIYMIRGNLRDEISDARGASADYAAAIALREAVRPDPDADAYPAWLVRYGNGLLVVYMNRGIQRWSLGDARGADADYAAAIALGESLRPDAGAHDYAAWLAGYSNDLAQVYMNRGNLRYTLGDAPGSSADYAAAIALGEALRPAPDSGDYRVWLARYGSDLLMVYVNRGNLRSDYGDPRAAGADYAAAIVLGEALRPDPTADHYAAWLSRYGNDLATVYMNRGSLRLALGDTPGADDDYTAAIALGEDLRPDPASEDYLAWLASDGDGLAGAYGNRGNLRRDHGDADGAGADYTVAIALCEALRPDPDSDAHAAWLARYGNKLAWVYMNRGILRNNLGDGRGAGEDYAAAIALREALRPQPGSDDYAAWLARYGYDLASVYTNRGNLRRNLDDTSGAGADYAEAIALVEALRPDFASDDYAAWLARYGDGLAAVYSNRGNLRSALREADGAGADYAACIALREALRPDPGADGYGAWLVRHGDELARVYASRGLMRIFLDEAQDAHGANADIGAAIALHESLRSAHGSDDHATWLAQHGKNLANLYSVRGFLRRAFDDTPEAGEDFAKAIALGKTLRPDADSDDYTNWLAQDGNDVAKLHAICEILRSDLDGTRGDGEDLTAAIELGEAMRPAPGSEGYAGWLAQHGKDQAKLYAIRGNLKSDLGEANGAGKDLSAAIALGKALRPDPTAEDYAPWAVGYINDLDNARREALDGHNPERRDFYAEAYDFLGSFLTNMEIAKGSRQGFDADRNGDREAAKKHFARAIALGEASRPDASAKEYATWLKLTGSNLAWVYSALGVMRIELGDARGANENFQEAIALHEALRPNSDSDDYPGWLASHGNDLASIYMNRGILRFTLGDARGAGADYAEAIALCEALRPDPGTDDYADWLAEHGNDLAMVYGNRGNLRSSLGEARGADDDYTAAIAIGEDLRPNPDADDYAAWLARYGNDLARTYANRGNLRSGIGDAHGAGTDYAEAIALGEALRPGPDAEDYAAWLNRYGMDLASIYYGRGRLRLSRAEVHEAGADIAAAIALGEALRPAPVSDNYTTWLVQYGNDFAKLYVISEALRGGRDDARGTGADVTKAIALREALRPGPSADDYPAWLARYGSDLANTYAIRGGLRSHLGEVCEADADYTEAIALGEALRPDPGTDDYPAWLARHGKDLAMVYTERGFLRYLLGDTPGAGADFAKALPISEALPSGLFVAHDDLRFRLYANYSHLLDTLDDPHAWAQEASQTLALGLELEAPPQPHADDPIAERRADYARFHRNWLLFALEGNRLEVIPTIVAAIQGRKLALLLLDELDHSHLDATTPEAVRRLKLLRRQLRDKAQAIQRLAAGDGQHVGPTGHGGQRMHLTFEADKAMERQRVDAQLQAERDYRHLLQEYRTTREQAAQYAAYQQLTAPYRPIPLADLTDPLPTGQFLVLWISFGDIHGLLILGQGLDPRWVTTSSPENLVLGLEAFGQLLEGTRGYRRSDLGEDGGTSAPEPGADEPDADSDQDALRARLPAPFWPHDGPSAQSADWRETFLAHFWDQATRELDTLLWGPLGAALAGQLEDDARLTLVTLGSTHLIPWDLGNPPAPLARERIVHFPGLLFYRHHRERAAPAIPASAPVIGLQHHSGHGRNRLYMVEPEIQAIDGYWRSRHPGGVAGSYDYLAASPQPVHRAHVSCHGGPDPAYPWSTVLHLKPDQTLDAQCVLACKTQPGELIAAACVAMTTREDPDGDPWGLAAAFLIRDIRALVGATLPVPDLWMPVLALLLHQSLGEGGRTLNGALAEAKRRLASGDWYPDTALRLRRHLPGGLARRWREQALPNLSQRLGPLQGEQSFLRLPSKQERQALRAHIAPLLPDRLPEAQAALADWSERHGLAEWDERLTRLGARALGETLQRWLLGEPGQPAAGWKGRLAHLVNEEPLADWGFDESERQLLWEALTQRMVAKAKEHEVLEADVQARNRKTRESLEAWRGETLARLAEKAIERKLLNRISRVPPQPNLGILLYGVRVYGQGASETGSGS